MHDPCARSRCLQERTTQKHLQKASVWSRPNTLRRLSQKCFYNSRVLERSQLCVPFYKDVGAFYSSEVLPLFLVEQVSSLWSKSHPCRASFLLVEQVLFLWSKSHPCRASLLLMEQVSSLLSKSHPCRASFLLVEQVSFLWSKSHPCRASLLLVEQVFKNLKLGGQVWAFVLSGAPHKEQALPSLGPWTWACWAR